MPETQAECVICRLPGQPAERGSAEKRYKMTCARCGSYGMSPEADIAIRQLRPEERPLLSHWVYEQNRLGVVPAVIRVEDIPSIKTLRRFSYIERTRLLLSYLFSKTNSPGQRMDVGDLKLQALLQTFDLEYINSLVQYLYQQGRCILLVQPFHLPAGSFAGASTYVILTPQGIMRAEELSQSYAVSTQGFVAMSFNPSLNDAWTNGFHPGIHAAGFRPFRIDNKDYIGGIADEIMAEIRRSRFFVADYTGQRNGVYFEAGFALGLGLRVIPTCRSDEVANLHFDIKHLNTLVWKSPAELAEGLNRRTVIGAGPDAPDPK